jgi:hypothetical protein
MEVLDNLKTKISVLDDMYKLKQDQDWSTYASRVIGYGTGQLSSRAQRIRVVNSFLGHDRTSTYP